MLPARVTAAPMRCFQIRRSVRAGRGPSRTSTRTQAAATVMPTVARAPESVAKSWLRPTEIAPVTGTGNAARTVTKLATTRPPRWVLSRASRPTSSPKTATTSQAATDGVEVM